ncbi:MAG: protein kinase [Labilithrix sp.]|nr:protein kinase [Labilithrix sp.]
MGRYALYGAIAAGGMATVHLGRLLGPVGFSRTVAIKRLHAQFASDPEFVSMFLDEARLAARIRHPNVVPTLDVVATGGELFLVMEYVPGESIARLSRALRDRNQTIPLRILSAVMAGVLHGLHAAHEAKDERGHPLGIVHRDMSPQNVLVGVDGVARVLDFGVAKAAGRMQTTRDGQIKGKLSYMPPEQLRGATVNRQTDIYAAGVMLWELVTGQRLFTGDNEGAIVAKVLEGRIEPPSQVLFRNLPRNQTIDSGQMRSLEALDRTILHALSMTPEARFATAREMALEIERLISPATGSEVADWVEQVAEDVLSSRAAMVAEIESSASHAVEAREGHVQSVLSAKATLGPGNRSSESLPPQSVTRFDRPASSHAPAAPTSQPVARSSVPLPLEGPPYTQPSSISVSTGTHGTRRADGERRTVVAALVGVLLGASVLATALVWRTSRDRTVADDPPSPASETPAETSPAPPAIADAGLVAVEPAPAVASSPPVTAAPVASPPPTKPSKPGARTPKTPASPAAAPATPTDSCEPPFWYDATGVKRYKPQCLGK